MEHFYQSIYEQNDVPIFAVHVDVTGDFFITGLNPALEAATGLRKEDAVGRRFENISGLSKESAAALRANCLRCLEVNDVITFRGLFVGRDQDGCWLTQLAPLRDGEGRIAYIIGFSMNITGADVALSESKEPFRALMEQAAEAFFLHDAGKILDVNKAACDMLGYSREELLRLFIRDVDVRFEHDRHEVAFWKQLAPGKAFTVTSELRRKDGTTLPVEINLGEVAFRGQRLMLGLVRDITERKQAEETLQRSEFFLRRSQKIGRIGSFVLDIPRDVPEDQSWQSTPAMDEIFGIDADYPKTGENWLKLIVQREEVSAYFSGQIANGQHLFAKEYQIVRPSDGEMRWINGRGDFEFDAQGRCIRLIGTVQDITERKRAEEDRTAHLRFFESMDRVNRAMHATNDLEQMMSDVLDLVLSIFDCDRASLLYPCDPVAEAWRVPMERSKPEYPGSYGLGLPLPMDADIAQTFRILLGSRDPVTFGPDTGHPVPKTVSERFGIRSCLNMVLYPKTGKPWQFMVQQCSYARVWTSEDEKLFQEIGRRLSDALTSLLTYRDLRRSEEFLNNLVDNIPNMIFVKDAETLEFVRFNKAGEQLLGYSQEEVLGKSVYDLFPGSEAELFTTKDREALATKALVNILEETITDRRNDQRTLHTRKIPLLDETGRPQYLLGISEDITERRKLEQQFRQAQKMEAVGRLAGGIAHDFNNMLGVIIGNAELAMAQVDPAQTIFAHMREVLKAAERSGELTRQLLAFARKQSVAPKVLDLNATVGGMLKMLRRLIGEDIDLLWEPCRELWPVKTDPTQIDQILANLCVNARDAISGVGKVTIETDCVSFDEAYCREHTGFVPGEYVLLAVSDDGMGMDKEVLEHLFEPFFTTKEVGMGTGLGLATVYGIVKQNDGFINVYSEPGMGTIFKIYFPRTHEDVSEVQFLQTEKQDLKGTETVLLVEDEESILALAKTILEWHGYTVLPAHDPTTALSLAQSHQDRIDLLITDVVMPGMNGRELNEKLVACNPALKCIFMSGYTANVIAHHGILDEGIHFLAKPFTVSALAEKVREVLDS